MQFLIIKYFHQWVGSGWRADQLVLAALAVLWLVFSRCSLGARHTWQLGSGSAKASENKWLHDTCVPKQIENFFYILNNTNLNEVCKLALFISSILFPFSIFSQYPSCRFKRSPIHISTNGTLAQLLLRGRNCGFSLREWCSEGR